MDDFGVCFHVKLIFPPNSIQHYCWQCTSVRADMPPIIERRSHSVVTIYDTEIHIANRVFAKNVLRQKKLQTPPKGKICCIGKKNAKKYLSEGWF